MWTLKIGGSILHAALDDGPARALSDARAALLMALRRDPGRFLLVPGGGRHADAVRAAQAAEGFDDDTAHVRALAAMDTSAAELAGLIGNTARVIRHLHEVRATTAAGLTPVWAPHADLAHDHTLPRDWTLTSDSIAAVAARRLALDGVCLLKRCAVPAGASAERLVASRIVDAQWPRWSQGIPSRVLGPEVWAVPDGLRDALGGMRTAGLSK